MQPWLGPTALKVTLRNHPQGHSTAEFSLFLDICGPRWSSHIRNTRIHRKKFILCRQSSLIPHEAQAGAYTTKLAMRYNTCCTSTDKRCECEVYLMFCMLFYYSATQLQTSYTICISGISIDKSRESLPSVHGNESVLVLWLAYCSAFIMTVASNSFHVWIPRDK